MENKIDKKKDTTNLSVIKPGKKGIVYENYRDFETSIFSKVYDKAKNLTKQIIERNWDLEKSKTHGNDFRNKEQFDNIICFIGRRGTGKTSAMLSFMEALKDHYKFHDVIEEDGREHYEFISLEWIDASMLEKNEDIFETILAKMFGELLQKNDNIFGSRKSDLDYEYRDLYQQFEKIYKRVMNLKKKEDAFEEEMPINVLRDLARSTEIRTDFARLVKSYIKFSEEVAGSGDRFNKDTYLVIAIDDIDLNVENGYEILEKIHRYFMVPGVIVLVAINYEEMLLCCEKRYVAAHRGLPKNIVENLGERAIQMSEEYLEKVLPTNMRVYLPSLKKTDYDLREKRRVEIENRNYSIKAGMFYLIWDRTRVFFDAKGQKRHFMEPVTLRNLNTNFQLYHNMKKFEEPKEGEACNESFWEVYDENYYKVIDDILFRFACDSLPNKEYRLFIKWSESDILRRGKEIVENVIADGFPADSSMTLPDNARNRDIEGFAFDYRRFEYSYGELLRSFYCMSRNNIYNKRLVHVLLAQYTVVFSRVFEKYKIDKKSNREKLEKLMGQSVGGSWAKYVLPRIKTGALDQEDSYWSASIYHSAEAVTLCTIENGTPTFDWLNDSVNKKEFSEYQSFLEKDEIKVLKIWMFFFSNFGGQSGRYSLVIRDPSEQQGTKEQKDETELNSESLKANPSAGESQSSKADDQQGGGETTGDMKDKVQKPEYKIRFTNGEVRFNVFDFVNKCFDYKNVIRNYYIAVFDAVYGVLNKEEIDMEKEDTEKKAARWELMEKEVDKIINEEQKDETSLLYEFNRWSEEGGLALPVYNLDITYNLIKRLVLLCKERNVSYIESKDAFDYIQKLFEEIRQKLKEQDDFYNEEVFQNEGNSNFAEIFEECPVIKRILDKNSQEVAKYKKVLDNYVKMEYKGDKEAVMKGLIR